MKPGTLQCSRVASAHDLQVLPALILARIKAPTLGNL